MSDNLKQFLVSLASDPEKLGGYLSDPDAVMAAAGLDPEDRAALRSGSQASIQARLSEPPAVNVVAPQCGTSIVHGPPHYVANLEAPPKYQYPYAASVQPYSPPPQPTTVQVHVVLSFQSGPPPGIQGPSAVYAPPPVHQGPSIVHAPPPLHGAEGATVFGPPKYLYPYSAPPQPYSPSLQPALVHVHVHPATYTSSPLVAPPLVAPPQAAAPAGGAAAVASAAESGSPREGLETV